MTDPPRESGGRWGGRLGSRPIPDPADDPEIADLDARDRAALAANWLGLAAAERRAADAFSVVRHDLLLVGADPELIVRATRAIDDELRHAEIGRVVAERFAGRPIERPAQLPLQVPPHAEAPSALRPTLHVIGQCALNETTASAYLEHCLSHATSALARWALRELLSDEIDHARIGWAYLAAAPPALRSAVGPWLLPMARGNLKIWRAPWPSRPSEAVTAHGMPPPASVDAALVEAMRTLILPGFEQLGLSVEGTAEVRRWVEADCPTD